MTPPRQVALVLRDESRLLISSGHKMPFKEALNLSSINLHVKALLPSWLISLRPQWRQANLAFDELFVSAG